MVAGELFSRLENTAFTLQATDPNGRPAETGHPTSTTWTVTIGLAGTAGWITSAGEAGVDFVIWHEIGHIFEQEQADKSNNTLLMSEGS